MNREVEKVLAVLDGFRMCDQMGVELKDSYYRQAVANVKSLLDRSQPDVFDLLEENE